MTDLEKEMFEALAYVKGLEDALKNMVKAWEALPPGRYTYKGINKVDTWLHENMSPAINAARKVLKEE